MIRSYMSNLNICINNSSREAILNLKNNTFQWTSMFREKICKKLNKNFFYKDTHSYTIGNHLKFKVSIISKNGSVDIMEDMSFKDIDIYMKKYVFK